MITKLIIDFWYAVLSIPMGWFPTDGPPAWVDDGGPMIQTMLGYGAGLSAWIPWPLVVTILPVVFGAILTGAVIKIVRMVLSLFTGGGGSAA